MLCMISSQTATLLTTDIALPSPTTSSVLPPGKMTSDSITHCEKATDPFKNDVLQEDEYEEPKWANIRDEPMPVIVAESSQVATDSNVDADDQDSDDDSSSSGDTIHTDTPSRSSTPRPHQLQTLPLSQPLLDTPMFDWSTGKYISIIKIEEERVSLEIISPSSNVDVKFFYAAISNDRGLDRILSPLRHSPSVWECTIVHAHSYILVWPSCDRNLSISCHFEGLRTRLQAEHHGYRVVLNKGFPRAYYGFHIDPRHAPPGMPGPMSASSGPSPVPRLLRAKSLPKKAIRL